MAERTEISFEVSPDEVAVLDGYCSAKNITRKTVIRQLLRDWSAEQRKNELARIRRGTNDKTAAERVLRVNPHSPICEPSGFAVHKAEIRKELAAV